MVGKAIGIALLGFNLLLVGTFAVEIYPLSASVQSTLWSVKTVVFIASLTEYLLRLYGVRDRIAELLNVYSLVDLLAILPMLAVLVLPVSSVAVSIGFLWAIRAIRVL